MEVVQLFSLCCLQPDGTILHFLDAWIQTDVVKPRDHSLTNQRSTCILQPLTTPEKKEALFAALSLSLQVLCALSFLFRMGLSSFTKIQSSVASSSLSLSRPSQTLCPFPATFPLISCYHLSTSIPSHLIHRISHSHSLSFWTELQKAASHSRVILQTKYNTACSQVAVIAANGCLSSRCLRVCLI